MNSVTFAKAIADENRQRIMEMLCCNWLCVTDIVEQLDNVSQPTVSHHLSVLREAGLVYVRRDGRQIFSLNQDEVAMCCGRLISVFAPERTQTADVLLGAIPVETK